MSAPGVGSWIVMLSSEDGERGIARVINATAEAASVTAAAFFALMVPRGATLRVAAEHEVSAAARFEANATTLLPARESLRP